MSDILPQVEPETQGRVKLDIPLTLWLSTAFDAGKSDSMLSAISRTTEDEVNAHKANNPVMQPDALNKEFATGDLKFTAPQDRLTAQAMHDREQQRQERELYLSAGASPARVIPGLAAGILGSIANPVDFGSMFIPFVGTGKKLVEGATIGNIMRRGLISPEMIARTGVPVPRLVGSMVQAGLWQGTAEIPKAIEAHVEHQPMPDVGADEFGQMAFVAVLHGAGSVASRIYDRLHGVSEGLKNLDPDTHDAMSRQAVNDFMLDKDTSSHQYIPMDQHVIEFQAMEHQRLLREEAANHVDVEQIKRDIVKEKGEYPIDAAIRNKNTSEVRTGPSHDLIDTSDYGRLPEPSEEGFVTDRGRFVSRDEAHELATGDEGTFNHLMLEGTATADNLTHNERTHYNDLVAMGDTEHDALNKIRDIRQKKREHRILSNPGVQAEIEQRKQDAIDKWVKDKQVELKDPVPDITKKTAREPITHPSVVEKYVGDQTHLNKALDEDLKGLGYKEPNVQKNEVTGNEVEPPVHQSIDTAINCILEKLL